MFGLGRAKILTITGACAVAALAATAAAAPAGAATSPAPVQVCLAPGGAQPDQRSDPSALSADGRSVFFTSSADNLLPGSTPQAFGYYRHDLRTNSTERLLQLPDPASEGQGLPAAVDGRGSTLLFGADGSKLLPGDTNQSPEAFALRLSRR